MSFVITVYVREGIVMTTDSRLTLNYNKHHGENQIVRSSVGLSDSAYKLFLVNNNIGISTFGNASVKGVPVTGYVESFINEKISENGTEQKYYPEDVAKMLCQYFREFPDVPNTRFHIAGYKKENNKFVQHVWLIDVGRDIVKRLNIYDKQGASWGGEVDILSRLINRVGTFDGKDFKQLPHYDIPWNLFTLQDAIDFSIYATKMTIDSMRFQSRPKTVGGPIDVLVIKPDKAFWIQKKILYGDTKPTK